MAFSKYAHANLIKPDIHMPAWDRVRDSAQALGSAFATREASTIALTEYNPRDYMLSHCTIVASVDTADGVGTLGRHLEGSFQVDRQFQDYLVAPKTSQYVNNNNDAWERKLLLSSFRTFVGGHNFVEHLQIPEMSKGRIIDAAARDIGDSVYIDILVATNRKHNSLIGAVNSGQLSTLSMGCTTAFTICTKCGNVAKDEPQLCPHIKYEKGNNFIGPLGQTYKVAELCGHHTSEPGSVKFIEASWVGNPAFKGAVVRNILSPEEAEVYDHLHAARTQLAFSIAPELNTSSIQKAARSGQSKRAFDFAESPQSDDQGQDADAPEPQTKEDADPIDSAVDSLVDQIRSKALQKLRGELDGGPETPNDLDENRNNSLIQQASINPVWRRIATQIQRSTGDPQRTRRMLLGLLLHKEGGWKAIASKFSGREVLAISRVLDALQGVPKVAGEARIYKTVLAVGGAAPYVDLDAYLAACRRVLGRDLNTTETTALVAKGRLFDLGQ